MSVVAGALASKVETSGRADDEERMRLKVDSLLNSIKAHNDNSSEFIDENIVPELEQVGGLRVMRIAENSPQIKAGSSQGKNVELRVREMMNSSALSLLFSPNSTYPSDNILSHATLAVSLATIMINSDTINSGNQLLEHVSDPVVNQKLRSADETVVHDEITTGAIELISRSIQSAPNSSLRYITRA